MSAEPVIIIGMHRSGTTMLVDILEDNGFYFGNAYGKNKEAHPFLALHEKVLRVYGCSWDNPYAFLDNYKNLTDTKLSLLFKSQTNSKAFKSFFLNSNDLWGWKDPRSCLFLEHWNEIYPKAKYIFIYRNPLDVAKSLETRAVKDSLGIEKQLSMKHFFTLVKNKLKNKSEFYLNSELCKNFQYSIKLWEVYNNSCLNFLETLNSDRYLSLKYEDLITNKSRVDEIASFLGKEIKVNDSFFVKARANANNDLLHLVDEKDIALWERLGYA